MRVMIVDDEPLAVAGIEKLLEGFEDVTLVCRASSTAVALNLARSRRPDVLLLDVEMPGENGIELAQELRRSFQTQIIFITAYPEYAVDSYEVDAADYLLKPVNAERLARALGKARERLVLSPVIAAVSQAASVLSRQSEAPPPEVEQVYWARVDGRRIRIPLDAVERIEACRDYVHIYTPDRAVMVRETMASLEEAMAGSAVVRVHKSHFVNLGKIEQIESIAGRRAVTMKSGDRVPVGRSYFTALRDRFEQDAA
ncbi:LytTR family DNA-binding domain-containing protein [Maricaulis sp.]|uniref:LytR/AlgR family response regulator transcription factor n=1 Tax=Maricaulis sp. TaxID=1486257 RepID=UPI002607FC99|nr:LytTR family DNA-binding domain-containing protein [Maricaulis sp.]